MFIKNFVMKGGGAKKNTVRSFVKFVAKRKKRTNGFNER
jgi:hypothetical protein